MIYLLHTYLVTAIKVLVIRTQYENATISIVVTFVIGLLVPYLVYVCSKRVKFLAYLFRPIALFSKKR